MKLFLVAIIGLVLGSFLHAWFSRTKKGESIVSGRSKCPNCKHVLAPIDLVPILSWLFLKGKCRYCNKKIPWHYPAAEFFGAIILIVVYFLIALR